MITFLASTVNALVIVLQNLVGVCSSVGEVIVLILTIITTIACITLKSVLVFFQIIYEDNIYVFTDDLPNLVNNLNDVLHNQWSHLYNILATMGSEVGLTLNILTNNVKWLFSTVIFVICEILTCIKKTVTFFGDTLWLLLTFVPVHLPELAKAFFKYVKDYIVNNIIEAYMVLLRVTNFLSDVPLQSFMGIITTIILVRTCIHFRETIHIMIINIYWTLIRKVTYLYHSIYNYFTDSEVRIITRMIGSQAVAPSDGDVNLVSDTDQTNGTDALCVICQERQKCVLILPCRHICLCSECCMRLYGYQRTCPICRTFIYHSVNVYL